MAIKYKLNATEDVATKDVISRTLRAADTYAGELSVELLPLDKIELDPENARELTLTLENARKGLDKNDPAYEKKKQDWDSLESLAKTIKDGNLINPIYVYRFGNMCRLISGERRTLASAIAGKTEIFARIARERPNGSKLRILQWIENHERSELRLSEKILGLEAILKEYCKENNLTYDPEKINIKVLSDLTGMSITQSRRYMLVLRSDSEIKKAIAEGYLESLKLIELISSVKEIEHQKELLKAAKMGSSFEAIEKIKGVLEKLKKDTLMEQIFKSKEKSYTKLYVNLGRAKPVVVKTIIDALVSCRVLDTSLVEHFSKNKSFENDVESLEKMFKKIISLLDSRG